MCNGKCDCLLSQIGKYLLVVGGLNWGLVGVGMLMSANWNVVDMLLGAWPMVEAIVYVLVGVAAVMKLIGCKCAKCANCVCAVAPGTEGKM